VKIRFFVGYDIDVPWPNAYCNVINETGSLDSDIDREDRCVRAADFEEDSNAISGKSIPANDADLLTEVNQFLDGFSLDEDDGAVEDDDFLFNYTSVLDTHEDKARETEDVTLFNANGEVEEPFLRRQSSSSLPPLETGDEKDYCVLLTGEKLSQSHLNEVEHYFDEIKSKKRKVHWRLAAGDSSYLTTLSSTSSTTKASVSQDQKDANLVEVHPEDDPEVVPSNPSILIIGQAQKVRLCLFFLFALAPLIILFFVFQLQRSGKDWLLVIEDAYMKDVENSTEFLLPVLKIRLDSSLLFDV
jgi:hypothetical protein